MPHFEEKKSTPCERKFVEIVPVIQNTSASIKKRQANGNDNKWHVNTASNGFQWQATWLCMTQLMKKKS